MFAIIKGKYMSRTNGVFGAVGVILSLLLFAESCLASTPMRTFVKNAGVYGSGDVFVDLVDSIDEAGCPGTRRLSLPSSHPQGDRVLAIALGALAKGRPVQIRTNGCYPNSPTLGAGRDSWFYME